jgi:energy-coupling factor transport system ATP-binding protein
MISLQQVTFTYPNTPWPALSDLDVEIGEGELVLVAGPSGVGKSTFLRLLNGLVPHFTGGELSGRIRVCGQDPVVASPKHMCQTVGFVFQDPETQFVMDRVEDDLAFTLENATVPRDEIGRRLNDIFSRLNLTSLRNRRIDTLSGGERQRVAIAAALLHSPKILVLDEPTSQLDPRSAEEVLQAVFQLHRSLGLTVLISEHRLERILPVAGRMIYFDARSRKLVSGEPRRVVSQVDHPPPLIALGLQLGWQPLPLTVAEARPFAQAARPAEPQRPGEDGGQAPPQEQMAPLLQASHLNVELGKTPILRQVSLDLYPGEVAALVGPNGCGKTTLLRTLTGLIHPSSGKITLHGEDITHERTETICRQVGYLPQDPNSLLFADRVIDELYITLQNHAIEMEDSWLQALLERFGLLEAAQRYPRDLSTGQRQRVALCSILVTKPEALLLDEPTRGMDAAAKGELQHLMLEWRSEGKALLLVTHDIELIAGVADRVIRMESGAIIQTGATPQVLGCDDDFTPQLMQLFPPRDG